MSLHETAWDFVPLTGSTDSTHSSSHHNTNTQPTPNNNYFYDTYTISPPIAHQPSQWIHPIHLDIAPPPARLSSSPAVPSRPPAYSSRFQITTPDNTPSRCRCQVDPPSEPPTSIPSHLPKRYPFTYILEILPHCCRFHIYLLFKKHHIS